MDTALVKTGLASSIGTDFNDTEEESYLAAYAFAASGKAPETIVENSTRSLTRFVHPGPAPTKSPRPRTSFSRPRSALAKLSPIVLSSLENGWSELATPILPTSVSTGSLG